MIEVKEKTINDSVYSVTQMPAMRAVRMQARLLKLIGPSFAAMIADYDENNPDASLPEAINLLTERLDEKSFETLVLDLTQGVRKDGAELTKQKIDLDFAGKLNELYLVILFVLQVNFSDFFRDGGIIADLQKLTKKTSVSPDTTKI